MRFDPQSTSLKASRLICRLQWALLSANTDTQTLLWKVIAHSFYVEDSYNIPIPIPCLGAFVRSSCTDMHA